MLARFLTFSVLMTLMMLGASGTLMPSFGAQAKDPIPTFDTRPHHRLGAGTEPDDRGSSERDRTE